MMDKLRKALNGQDAPEEESGFASQFIDTSSLSWSTRIQGFGICFVLGFLLSIIGIAFLAIPIKGLIIFAIFYTVGNVLTLVSTCFLMGPVKQIKKMFNETRLIATIAVFVFIVLTMLAAFKWKSTILAIVFCVCQFLALCWYSISYIPYARDAVKKTLTTCI